tara:strand:- start:1649 stop:2110 length:462 start_codon:yes stop_codon:yes gene_type:complete
MHKVSNNIIFNKSTLFSLLVLICLSISFKYITPVNAISNDDSLNKKSIVIEEIKLKVPKNYKDEWLQAEKLSWEPWLKSKDGFIERKLYWDPIKEESTLLISWENRQIWKSIPKLEIEQIQLMFEEKTKDLVGKNFDKNPFTIISEGELIPQQ